MLTRKLTGLVGILVGLVLGDQKILATIAVLGEQKALACGFGIRLIGHSKQFEKTFSLI